MLLEVVIKATMSTLRMKTGLFCYLSLKSNHKRVNNRRILRKGRRKKVHKKRKERKKRRRWKRKKKMKDHKQKKLNPKVGKVGRACKIVVAEPGVLREVIMPAPEER